MKNAMRAFEVTYPAIRGVRRIVAARTAGQARHGEVSAANDAGYDLTYSDVKVRRAKEFDADAEKNKGYSGPVCIGQDDNGMTWGCLA